MFKNNYKTILIATDLASRGWDLPTVNAIINFDMPYYKKNIDKSSVCYLHRVYNHLTS
jgi:superfamily II DNA/RNA helicase